MHTSWSTEVHCIAEQIIEIPHHNHETYLAEASLTWQQVVLEFAHPEISCSAMTSVSSNLRRYRNYQYVVLQNDAGIIRFEILSLQLTCESATAI